MLNLILTVIVKILMAVLAGLVVWLAILKVKAHLAEVAFKNEYTSDPSIPCRSQERWYQMVGKIVEKKERRRHEIMIVLLLIFLALLAEYGPSINQFLNS